MKREEVVEQIRQIMIEGFEVEPELLTPDAKLFDDLELDSLDAVDMVVSIEKRFGCRIPETEARAMTVLGDIYDYVANWHAGASQEASKE